MKEILPLFIIITTLSTMNLATTVFSNDCEPEDVEITIDSEEATTSSATSYFVLIDEAALTVGSTGTTISALEDDGASISWAEVPSPIREEFIDIGECRTGYHDALYKSFRYWIDTYNHRDNTLTESLAVFTEADSTMATRGADYSDYLCIAELSVSYGYEIDWVVKEGGYYTQLKGMKRYLTQ